MKITVNFRISPQKYIIKKLKQLSKRFPNLSIRYSYHALSNVHLVEVLPHEMRSDASYVDWESKMTDKFIKRYPYEGICFISDEWLCFTSDGSIYGIEYGDKMLLSINH
jgi:hypothetical protein